MPAQIPLLDEACEHLSLHEHLQEPPQAFGGDGFAEGFALKGSQGWGREGGVGGRGARRGGRGERLVLPLCSAHEEGVMTNYLHKEAHKGLGDDRVEGAAVWFQR